VEQPHWLADIRHGQSTGSVIAERPERDGLDAIDIPERDAELMAVARTTSIANCSVSSWRAPGGQLRPERFKYVEHLHHEGTAPTRQENVNADHA
jgi:hypothetical protein